MNSAPAQHRFVLYDMHVLLCTLQQQVSSLLQEVHQKCILNRPCSWLAVILLQPMDYS